GAYPASHSQSPPVTYRTGARTSVCRNTQADGRVPPLVAAEAGCVARCPAHNSSARWNCALGAGRTGGSRAPGQSPPAVTATAGGAVTAAPTANGPGGAAPTD